MNNSIWEVKQANEKDTQRWFTFASQVKKDFYDLDLGKDEKYRSGMIKNMKKLSVVFMLNMAWLAKTR